MSSPFVSFVSFCSEFRRIRLPPWSSDLDLNRRERRQRRKESLLRLLRLLLLNSGPSRWLPCSRLSGRVSVQTHDVFGCDLAAKCHEFFDHLFSPFWSTSTVGCRERGAQLAGGQLGAVSRRDRLLSPGLGQRACVNGVESGAFHK